MPGVQSISKVNFSGLIDENNYLQFINNLNMEKYGNTLKWKDNNKQVIYIYPQLIINDIDYFLDIGKSFTKDEWDNKIKQIQLYHYKSNTEKKLKTEKNEIIQINKKYIEYTPENIILYKQELLKIEQLKYKIHLQPKPEYLFWTLNYLVKNIIKNSDLNSNIVAIKCNLMYDRVMKEPFLPVIVIYLVINNKIKSILDILISLFKNLNSQIGLNICPRYNHTVNELIYYAQSGGDLKDSLNKQNKLELYFNKIDNFATVNQDFFKVL